ncbi:MAG: hypothetical protein EOP85_02150 [Verrucomicrobiaceae bacterium]|nr:MAG: hypothetical protein EOP85_02150 [Verrucomicrobiaceae bacterium]
MPEFHFVAHGGEVIADQPGKLAVIIHDEKAAVSGGFHVAYPIAGRRWISPPLLHEFYTFQPRSTHGVHIPTVSYQASRLKGSLKRTLENPMKTTSLQLIALLAATLTAMAKEPKPHGERRPPPPQPLLATLDKDRNGKLSPGEIDSSPESLTSLDKNGDGALSRKEIGAKPSNPSKDRSDNGGKEKAPPTDRKDPPPILATLDRDDDANLSADEIELAPDSLALLDTDGDGTLSREELKPAKPPVEEPTPD